MAGGGWNGRGKGREKIKISSISRPCTSHSAPPRMAIHVFFQRHVSHGQPTPTVICCRRIRGETSHTFASGACYGARATAHRSLPGPTSAHCESLCGQDRLGGSD